MDNNIKVIWTNEVLSILFEYLDYIQKCAISNANPLTYEQWKSIHNK